MTLRFEHRLEVLDALRGFALMGLFLVHMVSFYGLHWIDPKPSLSFDAVSWLFGGKAYALFSLLFGLSFFIIIDKQAQRGVDFRKRFSWRLLILAGFGFVHSLFYTGDILQVLAISGLVLIVINHWSQRAILMSALFFLLHIPTLLFLFYLTFDSELANSFPKFWGLTGVSNDVAAKASFVDMIAANASQSQMGKWWFYLESGRLWNIVGFALLGLWLGRIDFVGKPQTFKKWLIIGVIASFLSYLLIDYSSQWQIQPALMGWSLGTALYSYLNAFMMLTAAALFIWCFDNPSVQRVLLVLAPCGRMTLTLYVFQSVLFTPIFFGYGLGLYNSMPHDTALLIGIGLWVGQVGFAAIWFKYFQFGPLEWLWRSLTYTRTDVPFRKQAQLN